MKRLLPFERSINIYSLQCRKCRVGVDDVEIKGPPHSDNQVNVPIDNFIKDCSNNEKEWRLIV